MVCRVAGRPQGRPAVILELPSPAPHSARIIVGDCVAEMAKLPATASIWFSPTALQSSLQRDLKRPDDSKVDAVDDDWDQFAELCRLRRVHPRWLTLCKRCETLRHALG